MEETGAARTFAIRLPAARMHAGPLQQPVISPPPILHFLLRALRIFAVHNPELSHPSPPLFPILTDILSFEPSPSQIASNSLATLPTVH